MKNLWVMTITLVFCLASSKAVQAVEEKKMTLNDFKKEKIELKLPLLIVKGTRGFLACGYINVETCNKTKEACAIVTGVKTHEEMLLAEVKVASDAAKDLGIHIGMSGTDALRILR